MEDENNTFITVSIIGTSGRNNDVRSKDLTLPLLEHMVSAVDDIIATTIKNKTNKPVMLVSGGAPWADHVAVILFLRGLYQHLKLYTPAPFDEVGVGFADSGVVDWKRNPGGTLNYYHRAFTAKIKLHSLLQIKEAIEKGAVIDSVSKSFHNRNTAVAQSDYVIALTWSASEPTEGGTGDTWKKARGIKHHISLSNLAK